MKRERIYIIPTRFGLMYGGGILVTLLTATIYSNNLVYMLCFFLVALFLIAMHQTHNNMKTLQFEKLNIDLLEEDSFGNGILWLNSRHKESHHQVKAELLGTSTRHNFFVDKTLGMSASPHKFTIKGSSIGVHQILKVKLSSIYPFGLFYAWKVFPTKYSIFTYPKPEGHNSLPEQIDYNEAKVLNIGSSGEDFSQHKKYEKGESQRHIDWKAFARGRPLMIKEFKDGQKHNFLFDLNGLREDPTTFLRQISKWIQMAHQGKHLYGLKGSKIDIKVSQGEEHRQKCLKALAEFGGNLAG